MFRKKCHCVQPALIKCQGVSVHTVWLLTPFCVLPCRVEYGDHTIQLLECVLINGLAVSIKTSCDICDAWPSAGSGVPHGADPGLVTLAHCLCQLQVQEKVLPDLAPEQSGEKIHKNSKSIWPGGRNQAGILVSHLQTLLDWWLYLSISHLNNLNICSAFKSNIHVLSCVCMCACCWLGFIFQS